MQNNFTALLIDDEALSLTVIENYLKPFSNIEIVGKYTKSKEAVQAIIESKPDLLFLDIQMPVLNGFELLEAIAAEHMPYIIFTTAFEQYAIQAFEVNAMGYVLKPFSKEKFDLAVNRFLAFKQQVTENDVRNSLAQLLNLKPQSSRYLERVMIKEKKKIYFIAVDDILFLEASGDYVKVRTENQSHLIHETLSALESKLSPERFVRIHRSHIVNILSIQEFIPHFNGEYNIVMRNKEVLKLSRNYKDNLIPFFNGL